MTADEIAVKIGLRPFAEFCDPIQSFAAAYGCDARRSGRTTRAACQALSAASVGKRVVFVAYRQSERDRIAKMLIAAARAADLVVIAVCATGLELFGGGWVRVVAPLEPYPRCDQLFGDNHNPLVEPPKRRCLHRLLRAERSCSVCGLKLRRARDLRKARLRQRMMTEQRPIWDHLRISAIDALFKSKDT